MILALVIGVALAASPAPETPQTFIERLYASYADSSFNPLTHPERYFAPKLVAAMKEDARLAKGEVGYLDGDPVCQCQDPAGLHATVTDAKESSADKAAVRVFIDLEGYETRTATFSLVRTSDGWRISDVSSADEPSLLRSIEDSNSTQRSKH